MALDLQTTPRVLVLGGARSGKSVFSESLVEKFSERVYIATAEARDDEMRARIADHRARRGDGWRTIEAPVALPNAIRTEGGPRRALLVDCLTLWLTNLILAEHDVEVATDDLVSALQSANPTVLVANEVGLGIVPDTPLGRRFRDAAGRLNQRVAALADAVVFVAAGLPLILKPTTGHTG